MKRSSGKILLAVVLTIPLVFLPLATTATEYTFTSIDVPGVTDTEVFGINDFGHIVGHCFSGNCNFLGIGGSFTIFNGPGFFSKAVGINNSDNIVGLYHTLVNPNNRGFLYSNGSFTTIAVPGARITQAFGINDSGDIVGVYGDMAADHGFLYSNGNFTIIDVPGALATTAFGINNFGHIVGTYAGHTGSNFGFLYVGGNFTTIVPPGSSTGLSTLYGINDTGHIVGCYDAAVQHCFVYVGGTFTEINIPGVPYGIEARGINNAGIIVGFYGDGTRSHGFIATPVPTPPPVITISATPDTLWPPNGQLVPVTITGSITDEDSAVDEITATYAVIDEYGSVQPSGNITLDANGTYTFTIQLQASRRGNDRDGRQYTIIVNAQDEEENMGSADTIVTVPQNQGQGQGIAAR